MANLKAEINENIVLIKITLFSRFPASSLVIWLLLAAAFVKNCGSTSNYDDELHSIEEMSSQTTNTSSEFRSSLDGRRSKVDRLGSLLKRRVTTLRKESEIDLVFLVDSSASVGSQNFGNEIKFVRKVSSTRVEILHQK